MRLIIDSDPGMGTAGTDPEDGMAVLYALNTPGITVEGITLVQGNVPISHSWPNVRHLLDLAGRNDVPVHPGALGPRRPDLRAFQAAWLAQRDGTPRTVPVLVPPPSTAAPFLRDTVLDAPGEITVVAIGPLTNVAAAIEADPRVAGALAGLVIMGGTVAVPGNITPAAEFNIWMDPEAAEIVFASGAPITMVGLDVCHRTHFGRDQAEALATAGTALSDFVARAATSWIDVRERLFPGDEALNLYDTLAVAAAVEPDLLGYAPALVEIETSTGPAQGMTVTHRNDLLRRMLTGRDHNARVAIDIDTERFTARFTERVTHCL
jgi:purine nucleosidase